jgi:SAM-dependent methyltransferase
MAIANVEMAAAWDGAEGAHWTEHAERYESIGPAYWEALAAGVGIRVDDDVLDVGCGTGRSARDAARIATSGTVLGVDLSGRMLERARAAAEAEGLVNVRFEQADAQVHPFPSAGFDVAVSSFGAMFFADPVAAFANIFRSLRPDGRLGLLAWRPLEENEWLCALRGALAAGRDLPTPPPGVAGPFGLADPVYVDTVLRGVGFVDVAVDPFDAPMRFGDDTEDAFAFVSTLGITRGLLSDLDADAATAAVGALRTTMAEHETPDGVLLGGAAWVVTARSPGRTN